MFNILARIDNDFLAVVQKPMSINENMNVIIIVATIVILILIINTVLSNKNK